MSQDRYQKGQELSKAGIYQILAEETWRDGEVSRGDSELLEGLRKYLRLSNEDAMQILDLAEERFRQHTLGRLRDFSPNQCYARALRYAYSDAPELSKREDKYLRGLRSALGLKDSDHQLILKRLEDKGWSRHGKSTSTDSPEAKDLPSPPPSPAPPAYPTDKQPQISFQDEVPKKPDPVPRGTPVALPELETPPSAPPEEPKEVPQEETPPVYRATGAEEEPVEEPKPPPPPKRRKKKRRKEKKPEEAKAPAAKKEKSSRKKNKVVVPEATPAPGFAQKFEAIPPVARLILLVGVFTCVMLIILPNFVDPPGFEGPDIPVAAPAGQYEKLEEEHGKALFKVKRLVVRGPSPPAGPPLDLGEAWDLHAGRDGKLYGTALYRIFQIDPATGVATWIAGTGVLGEAENGADALKSDMDPASPRVDAAGRLYFRQGDSAIYRIGKDKKLERILGTQESRTAWKDGDKASEARPGAIEQIALGAGGRLYFDEYSGEMKGPEIIGRIEPGERLRAMFLFSMEPLDHSYRQLIKTFINSGNGLDKLKVGEDGGVYFVVGKSLYRWMPGQGPPILLLQESPLDFAIDRKGGLIVVRENRLERWYDIEKWTKETKFVEIVAGGSDLALSSAESASVLPGTAVGYHQPRDLTIGVDGTLFVLDGVAGGSGMSRPRIDMIKRVDSGSKGK